MSRPAARIPTMRSLPTTLRSAWIGGIALWLAAGVSCPADVLTLNGGTAHRGVFQGYENRKFRFLTADNQDLKELASNVKSLALDRPVKADVLPAVGKLMEGVLVQGYEKLALQFMKGGET
jgi:hypothetical protein